jgi:outer membrane receptor protein involved in Fe transport
MRKILRALPACALASLIAPAFAQNSPNEYTLDIGQLPLSAAIVEFCKQTGLQVGGIPEDPNVENIIVPALKGQYTAEAALRELLRSTGLTFKRTNSRTIAVMTPSKQTTGSVEPRWEASSARVKLLHLVDSGSGGVPGQFAKFLPVGSGAPYEEESEQPPRSSSHEIQIEEVVVTGTHIRGVSPVGTQLHVIDREAIIAGGYSRIQDLLDELPQNFSGSTGEDTAGNDFGAANYTRGQAVDLRGLGASSTLVLVNGRRQPAGGVEGGFVDITSIATSAIDRVEVLTDGASALYGADAIGGVVNFVLRDDFEGQETSVRAGTIDGAAQEWQASHLFGGNWNGGNLLVGYQYFYRDALLKADTPYGSLGWDYRSLGGDDFRVPGGNPGTILDPLTFQAAYAIPENQDGRNLTVADLLPNQATYRDDVTGIAALPEQAQHAGFFTLSQRLGSTLELFAEGRYGRRTTEAAAVDPRVVVLVPPTNPFYVNPFGSGPLFVRYSFDADETGAVTERGETDTYAFTTGAAWQMGREWALNVAASYGREKNAWTTNILNASALTAALNDSDPETALNVFGDGAVNNPETLRSLMDIELRQGTYTIQSVTAIVDGPLAELPMGSARLAIGFDYRDEQLDAWFGRRRGTTGDFSRAPSSVGELGRHVAAAFGEMVIPLWSRANEDRQQSVVDVAIAARYEDYSDFGSTLNPRIGINIRPLSELRLRGTWGTSFRAPRFNQLSSSANPSFATGRQSFADPRSPTGFSNVLFLVGGNPDLKEERADVWTGGIDWSVAQVPGLSLSSTYFHIDYKDKIQQGAGGENALQLEDQWAELITRDPTQEQVDAICGSPDFIGTCPPNVVAIIDRRLRNLAMVNVRGVDVDIDYDKPLGPGYLHIGLGGTHILKYERAVSSTAPLVDVVDTVDNPLGLRLRAIVSWHAGEWGISAAVNYTDDYRQPPSNRKVPSWTTVNSSVSYSVPATGWLKGTRIQLSALNIFDEEPPFVNQLFGYDTANASQIGRSASLTISKVW